MRTFEGTECFQGTTPEHLCLSLYQSKLSLSAQDMFLTVIINPVGYKGEGRQKNIRFSITIGNSCIHLYCW